MIPSAAEHGGDPTESIYSRGGVVPTRLLLGPLLRFVDGVRATVWVETSAASAVTVQCDKRSFTQQTWGVFGHHYCVVEIDGLEPGHTYPYSVAIDENAVWPRAGTSPSLIRTLADGETVRIAFGSCRRGESHSTQASSSLGADALVATANSMASTPTEQWPDIVLFLGDQIYADQPSERLISRIVARREAGYGPADLTAGDLGFDVSKEACDFEEYSWLYHESWDDPDVRWLLSTVPTGMILDDHDLRDDWNSSMSWRQSATRQPWWRDRVIGGFGSYYVYQHLGNLSPDQLAADPTYQALLSAETDAERETILVDHAWLSDVDPVNAQWSYHRDVGHVRIVMLDVRASRNLDPENRRVMDDVEWEWARRTCLEGEFDHLIVGSSLPVFMLPALHHIEGWNEKIAQSTDQRPVSARFHEGIRLLWDMEHWAAFRRSFDDLMDLLREVANPVPEKTVPSSILLLGGDVHCSFLEEARIDGIDRRSIAVHQLVMSPFRNPLHRAVQLLNQVAMNSKALSATRALAKRQGVVRSDVDWDVTGGPWFDNGIMTLVVDGRRASVEVEHAYIDRGGTQRLALTAKRALA